MATDVAVQTPLKFRDGKRWKKHRCVLRKLSPVSDCLQICFDSSQRNGGIMIEHFCGIECATMPIDKEAHTMLVVCRDRTLSFAFHNLETLSLWTATIHKHLGEERHFSAELLKIQPTSNIGSPQSPAARPMSPRHSRIPLGPVSIFIREHFLSLATTVSSAGSAAAFIPPRCLAFWNITQLKRFGVLDGKFCCEVEEDGVSSVYILSTAEAPVLDNLLKERSNVLSSHSSLSGTESTSGFGSDDSSGYEKNPDLFTRSSSERTLCASDSAQTPTDDQSPSPLSRHSSHSRVPWSPSSPLTLDNVPPPPRPPPYPEVPPRIMPRIPLSQFSPRRHSGGHASDGDYADIVREMDVSDNCGIRKMQRVVVVENRSNDAPVVPSRRIFTEPLSPSNKTNIEGPSVPPVKTRLRQRGGRLSGGFKKAPMAEPVSDGPGISVAALASPVHIYSYVSSYTNPSYYIYNHNSHIIMYTDLSTCQSDTNETTQLLPSSQSQNVKIRHSVGSMSTRNLSEKERNELNRHNNRYSDVIVGYIKRFSSGSSLDGCIEKKSKEHLTGGSALKKALSGSLLKLSDHLRELAYGKTTSGKGKALQAAERSGGVDDSVWKARSMENVLGSHTGAERLQVSVVSRTKRHSADVETILGRLEEEQDQCATSRADPRASLLETKSPTRLEKASVSNERMPADNKVESSAYIQQDPDWICHARKPLPYYDLTAYDGEVVTACSTTSHYADNADRSSRQYSNTQSNHSVRLSSVSSNDSRISSPHKSLLSFSSRKSKATPASSNPDEGDSIWVKDSGQFSPTKSSSSKKSPKGSGKKLGKRYTELRQCWTPHVSSRVSNSNAEIVRSADRLDQYSDYMLMSDIKGTKFDRAGEKLSQYKPPNIQPRVSPEVMEAVDLPTKKKRHLFPFRSVRLGRGSKSAEYKNVPVSSPSYVNTGGRSLESEKRLHSEYIDMMLNTPSKKDSVLGSRLQQSQSLENELDRTSADETLAGFRHRSTQSNSLILRNTRNLPSHQGEVHQNRLYGTSMGSVDLNPQPFRHHHSQPSLDIGEPSGEPFHLSSISVSSEDQQQKDEYGRKSSFGIISKLIRRASLARDRLSFRSSRSGSGRLSDSGKQAVTDPSSRRMVSPESHMVTHSSSPAFLDKFDTRDEQVDIKSGLTNSWENLGPPPPRPSGGSLRGEELPGGALISIAEEEVCHATSPEDGRSKLAMNPPDLISDTCSSSLVHGAEINSVASGVRLSADKLSTDNPAVVTQDVVVKSRKPNLTVDLSDAKKVSEETGARGNSRIGSGLSCTLPGHGSKWKKTWQDARSSFRTNRPQDRAEPQSSDDRESVTNINARRPRSGKEYQVIHRRHLKSDDGFFTPQPSPFPRSSLTAHSFGPQRSPCGPMTTGGLGGLSRPHAEVFTFDTHSPLFNMSYSSGDESSPRYPSSITSHGSSRSGRIANVAVTHSGSPSVFSYGNISCPSSSELTRRVRQHHDLNYADIDLSDSSSPRTPRLIPAPGVDQSKINYAELDLIATSAAAQAGRQHARGRLGTLPKESTLGSGSLSGKDVQKISPSGSLRSGKTSSFMQRKSSIHGIERKAETGDLGGVKRTQSMRPHK